MHAINASVESRSHGIGGGGGGGGEVGSGSGGGGGGATPCIMPGIIPDANTGGRN